MPLHTVRELSAHAVHMTCYMLLCVGLLQTAADCEAQPSYDGRRMKTVGTGVDGCLTRDSGGLDVRTNDGWDSSLFCKLFPIAHGYSLQCVSITDYCWSVFGLLNVKSGGYLRMLSWSGRSACSFELMCCHAQVRMRQ